MTLVSYLFLLYIKVGYGVYFSSTCFPYDNPCLMEPKVIVAMAKQYGTLYKHPERQLVIQQNLLKQ